MDFLNDTGLMQENVSHRPAKLFEFDEQRYIELKNKGIQFRALNFFDIVIVHYTISFL